MKRKKGSDFLWNMKALKLLFTNKDSIKLSNYFETTQILSENEISKLEILFVLNVFLQNCYV